MEVQELIGAFEREGSSLDAMLREHPLLRPLFSRNFDGVDRDVLKTAYLRLLKLKADYVQYTVPALLVASEVLRGGDDEDRRWSELLLGYGAGETDLEHDYGHQVWAHADMRALGAAREVIYTPPPAGAVLYARYFIDDVAHHPYAILGAKGVLEHFSIRVSDDVVRGILESGIANAENATRFFGTHGVVDVTHVREGDRNLAQLAHEHKRFQILEGAYFTSGAYRSLVHYLLPS
jgi:pyrroloquinoline quinone (PQQ) biosynthesis protein C